MIKLYNRQTKNYEIEQVAGEKFLNWSYESPVGRNLTELLLKRKLFSKVYGKYCDSKNSKKKISPFVEKFNIDMNISTKKVDEFTSFNDFFARTLIKSARLFNESPNALISPGDGRLTAYTNIDMNNIIQVKGLTYSLSELIKDDEISKEFNGGVCLVLRLCPTDYHRFHFIDNGIPTKSHFIKGSYYSVNPISVERVPKLFCQNKREWSILKSESFGDILHIEVGATCVGSIIQSYTPDLPIKKGDEKGYFKFGGSTTILFFKKNTVCIDEDILEQSSKGIECKVLFGETIGKKSPN